VEAIRETATARVRVGIVTFRMENTKSIDILKPTGID
jgi:hypothetical protein